MSEKTLVAPENEHGAQQSENANTAMAIDFPAYSMQTVSPSAFVSRACAGSQSDMTNSVVSEALK